MVIQVLGSNVFKKVSELLFVLSGMSIFKIVVVEVVATSVEVDISVLEAIISVEVLSILLFSVFISLIA
jgi:hypothetical protein